MDGGKMKAPIKILTMLTAGILAIGVTGCGGNSDDRASSSSVEATATATDDATSEEAEDEFENGYVECDGEKTSLNDWSMMFSSNPLAMDNYIGKEITVVSDFQTISTTNQFYYESYEASRGTDLPTSYEPPVGLMVLDGSIYVDIPEADQAMVSSLKMGDEIEVTGTISGFAYGATFLFAPTAGSTHTGNITIEKIS
ncbi:MAG: hypothetical protein K2N91_01105 [Muribaculaceae bacterium]|nr:hypothetical protein [Muribaculaceae bacterium]